MPTTQYIYLGHQYLCEADETGTLTKRCVNEPGTYTNLVSRKDLTTGETSYPLYDALGSTRAVTEESGDVTDTFVYDAWGNVLDRTGTTEIPFQYVGRHGYYHDEETSLSYVMARIYNPRIVRWLSVDPAWIIMQLGAWYAYSSNSPCQRLDFTGRYDQPYYPVVPPLIISRERPPYPRDLYFDPKCLDPVVISPTCDNFLRIVSNQTNGNPLSVKGRRKADDCIVKLECKDDCCPAGQNCPAATPAHTKGPNPTNRVITICLSNMITDSVESIEDYWRIFRHEHQHAQDFCMDSPFEPNCSNCKKYESRAHEVNCAMSFQMNSVEYKNCVECGVYLSCVVFGKWCGSDEVPMPTKCDSWRDLGLELPNFRFPK